VPVVGLDHVQVAAPRDEGAEDAARSFYGEVEKPEVLRARGGVWFSLGQGELHVGLEASHTPARKAHPALLVRGLLELTVRLANAGVEIVAADELPGVRRCFVFDPFGNRIELMERT
jgi:catechol 2,3-dioxygenase-like lactoylglutathione lyase family enzyme